MTDKQIINGVDVSGCKESRYYDNTYHCDLCHTEKTCKDFPNCYYKQLKRKEQECEEIFAKTYQMWMYYIANGLNNASDLNTQYLLEDLGKVTKMLADLCGLKDSTLNYFVSNSINYKQNEQLDQLKAENEKLKEKFKKFFNIDNQECWDIAFLNNEKEHYKQALDEIERIADKVSQTNSWVEVVDKMEHIRNIINKAKDGE